MNSPHCLKPYRPPSCWEATSDKIAFIAPFSWAFPHFICEMWETSSLFLSRLDTSELYTGFFVILSFYAEKRLSLSVICMYWVSCMKANPVLVPQVISTLATGFYFHTSHLVCCHLTLFKKKWCWVFQRFLFHIFRWYEIQGIRGEEFRKTTFFGVLNRVEHTSWWNILNNSFDKGWHSSINQLPILRFPWVKLVR